MNVYLIDKGNNPSALSCNPIPTATLNQLEELGFIGTYLIIGYYNCSP